MFEMKKMNKGLNVGEMTGSIDIVSFKGGLM